MNKFEYSINKLSSPFFYITEKSERITSPFIVSKYGKQGKFYIELSLRILLVFSVFLIILPAIFLFFISESSKFLINKIRKKSFIQITQPSQNRSFVESKHLRIMSWNINLFPGGLPIRFGGVRPAAERVEKIVQQLLESDADVICLQEVHAENLCHQLVKKVQAAWKKHHFYSCYNIGPKAFGFNSGLLILSKYPLENKKFHAYTFKKCQAWINKGYFEAKINGIHVINTHLDPFNAEVRKKQIKLISDKVLNSLDPSIIVGDLNIIKDSLEGKEFLKKYHHRLDSIQNTCVDKILMAKRKNKTPPKQTKVIDYALVHKNDIDKATLFRTEIVYEPTLDPETTLSDHAALLTEIQFI